ncbi:MAG: hypothetical protein V4471_05540 [Pseudomonadota bacterium]
MPKNILQNSYLYLLGYRDNLSLGKCFHYGQHVKKNLKLARSFYLKATQQGSADAFYQLYVLAKEEGRASEADYYLGRKHECLTQWQEALTAYKRAGDEGYVFAFYRAGLLFKRNRVSTPSQTIKKDLVAELAWYRKAAAAYSKHGLNALLILSAKESKAALHLAQMYEKGEIGNKKLLSTAVDYYKKASKMGDSIAAYRLGQLYELGEETFKRNRRKAFTHYLVAAKKQDKKALEGLERVVKKLNDSNLQLQLAELYENPFHKKELALKSFKELADKGNQVALERMNLLANRYVSCAYELGRAYELSHHYCKAFTYYLIAAKKRDEKALAGLESAISKLDDSALQFQLADVYENNFNKKELALKYFKILADQGNKAASARMTALAKTDANCAYKLAKTYETDANKEKAFHYYILAMQNDHSGASDDLTCLAESGDAEAQYTLGYLYYHPQRRFTEAIRWCLLAAEQQHSKATDYINNMDFPSQHYLGLAKSYEEGEKVSKNKDKALYFYEKAMVEKDNETAFCLGQLNQFDNEENAFDYFVKAAQWGHTEAVQLLERLAAELDPNRQLQLANLYRDPPFNNKYKALYWSRQAIIASDVNSSLVSDEALIKLIEDTKKSISFKNLKLFSQKLAHEPILTSRSLFNLLK